MLNQSVTSALVFESHLLTATENLALVFPESKDLKSSDASLPTLPTIVPALI